MCTWHLELSVPLGWQSRNRGEAVSDSPVSLTDPHRKIISCALRCGAPQGSLSKTHLPPANTHNQHSSIRFIWQRGSCGAKGPGGGEKRKKENNRWDRCQPGVATVFPQCQRKTSHSWIPMRRDLLGTFLWPTVDDCSSPQLTPLDSLLMCFKDSQIQWWVQRWRRRVPLILAED